MLPTFLEIGHIFEDSLGRNWTSMRPMFFFLGKTIRTGYGRLMTIGDCQESVFISSKCEVLLHVGLNPLRSWRGLEGGYFREGSSSLWWCPMAAPVLRPTPSLLYWISSLTIWLAQHETEVSIQQHFRYFLTLFTNILRAWILRFCTQHLDLLSPECALLFALWSPYPLGNTFETMKNKNEEQWRTILTTLSCIIDLIWTQRKVR